METSKQTPAAALDRLLEDTRISVANKAHARNMMGFMQAKGRAGATVIKHLYHLRVFLTNLGEVDASLATKQDIQTAMGKAEVKPEWRHKETKRNHKAVVKFFYKHLTGDDEDYPKCVKWIKTSGENAKMILPEDLLDDEDITKMLEASDNPRDKAIISLLYDSGIRAGELVNMKRKDVSLDENPAHITVDGKTGMRRIPIIFSAPYLANYLNNTRNRQPEEPLFMDGGTWSNLGRRLEHPGVGRMLKRVRRKAGIRKRVYPHIFRHSAASRYAKSLNEPQLRQYFGWSKSSNMTATYVHISGRDIDNAILGANGLKPTESTEPKLKVKVCPKCRYTNGMDFMFCSRCGSALDVRVATQLDEDIAEARRAMIKSLKDPRYLEELVKAIARERKAVR